MGRIEGTDRRRARAHVVADARDDEDERWGWTRDVHGGRCAGGDAERGGAGEPGGALRGERDVSRRAVARAPGQRCERVVIGQVFVSGGTGERGVWVVGDAVDDAGGEVSVRQGVLRFGETGGDEAASVKNYFDTVGFERWNKIYGETDEVNKVQLDIREGHQQTVDKVLDWVKDEDLAGVTVCDAGCGTGSLAIPLALKGASVSASDISSSMVGEAERRYDELVANGAKAPETAPKFEAMGLEDASGKYDMVTCIDVMIHYPKDRVDGMINHLASLSSKKLIISFAPKTMAYLILKRVGELFPGPSKATRAYLHDESAVEVALKAAGFKVKRREMTATSFYFSRLLECERV